MPTLTAVIEVVFHAAAVLAVGLAYRIAQYARIPALGVVRRRAPAGQLPFWHFVAGRWRCVRGAVEIAQEVPGCRPRGSPRQKVLRCLDGANLLRNSGSDPLIERHAVVPRQASRSLLQGHRQVQRVSVAGSRAHCSSLPTISPGDVNASTNSAQDHFTMEGDKAPHSLGDRFAVKAVHGQGTCPRCRGGNFGVFAHTGRPLPSFPRRRESSNQPCISGISIQVHSDSLLGARASCPQRAEGPRLSSGQDARAPRGRVFATPQPFMPLGGRPDHADFRCPS